MSSEALRTSGSHDLVADFVLLNSNALKSSVTTSKTYGNISSSYRNTLDYVLYDFWEEHSDPTYSHLPLISGGPWKVVGIVVAYLLTITVLLPSYMKNRRPYECRKPMIYYNLFNVVANLIGFTGGMIGTNLSADVWGCKEKYFPSGLVYLGYGYLVLKFVDFLDTVFFVLRKKYNQVSFLHVTHHCIMPLTCYVGFKFVPYGNTGFTPIINSLVHVIMYFYYYLAALGPKYSHYLWWKKYITLIQLIQFAIGMVHALQVYFVPGCRYPRAVANFELAEALFFFITFSNFYRKTYWNKTSKLKSHKKD